MGVLLARTMAKLTDKLKLATGSLSLGQHASHRLDDKIVTAAKYGFDGIEIVYSDLERYSAFEGLSMLEAAVRVQALAARHGVKCLALAPLENWEGHNSPLEGRLAKARDWIEIARKLHAPFLQVPAQFGEDSITDEDVIVDELQQLADLGTEKEPHVSIAYEALSWSKYVSTWQICWKIIDRVDRKNFGQCLDSFHILTKLWGSPYSASGKYENADAELAKSLAGFKKDYPIEKLFYVQLSDGEKFDPPFSNSHPWYLEGEAAEFTWSKHARPFPGESEYGAYMPVEDFFRACVVEKGFEGWVSMEIFDRRMCVETYKIDVAAKRALQSWERLLADPKASSKL